MALLDVAFLMEDPDFSDPVILIRRSQVINNFGEMVLTETSTQITAVVQSTTAAKDSLERFKEAAHLTDGIQVFYKGVLYTQSGPTGYCDIIFWRGYRFQVKSLDENFLNYGAGFTKAICILEPASA
jgi:hypothetical protein